MGKIKNINLEFGCNEKLDDKLFCEKCSRKLVDFRNKSKEEFDQTLLKSETVCGLFKKSQLSSHFIKYAAATLIATSALSSSAYAQGVAIAKRENFNIIKSKKGNV